MLFPHKENLVDIVIVFFKFCGCILTWVLGILDLSFCVFLFCGPGYDDVINNRPSPHHGEGHRR